MSHNVLLLPLELWLNILDNLDLADFANLLGVDKALKNVLDQEVTYEHLSRSEFPDWSLQTSVYGNSWKRLFLDHNSENGVYCRRMHVQSSWKHNSPFGLYYVNALRCMIWDRKEGVVQIGIEAFGESDLRKASRTTIYRLNDNGTAPEVGVLPATERWIRQAHAGGYCYDHPMAGGSHDLSLLEFDDKLFQEGMEYGFCYDESPLPNGTYYPYVTFLPHQKFTSLPRWFDLKRKGGKCEFLPRNAPRLSPSTIEDWPESLPEGVRVRHRRGVWGAVKMDRVSHE